MANSAIFTASVKVRRLKHRKCFLHTCMYYNHVTRRYFYSRLYLLYKFTWFVHVNKVAEVVPDPYPTTSVDTPFADVNPSVTALLRRPWSKFLNTRVNYCSKTSSRSLVRLHNAHPPRVIRPIDQSVKYTAVGSLRWTNQPRGGKCGAASKTEYCHRYVRNAIENPSALSSHFPTISHWIHSTLYRTDAPLPTRPAGSKSVDFVQSQTRTCNIPFNTRLPLCTQTWTSSVRSIDDACHTGVSFSRWGAISSVRTLPVRPG